MRMSSPAHTAAELSVHGDSATLTQRQPVIGCNFQLSIEEQGKVLTESIYAARLDP